MDQSPEEITAIVGREVYTNNGVFVGEVEDLQLDLDAETVTALALTHANQRVFGDTANSSRGVLLPYRWVRAVGDVIIVNDIVERLDETSTNT